MHNLGLIVPIDHANNSLGSPLDPESWTRNLAIVPEKVGLDIGHAREQPLPLDGIDGEFIVIHGSSLVVDTIIISKYFRFWHCHGNSRGFRLDDLWNLQLLCELGIVWRESRCPE